MQFFFIICTNTYNILWYLLINLQFFSAFLQKLELPLPRECVGINDLIYKRTFDINVHILYLCETKTIYKMYFLLFMANVKWYLSLSW